MAEKVSTDISSQLGFDVGTAGDRVTPPTTLQGRYVVPMFSTLDTRAGYWRERKRDWLSWGMEGEQGREAGLTYQSGLIRQSDFYRYQERLQAELGRKPTKEEVMATIPEAGPGTIEDTGTSVFDPVLCEIAYRWFTARGHNVLDPFAGGPVRGHIASILGRQYTGVELRPVQVAANRNSDVLDRWDEWFNSNPNDPNGEKRAPVPPLERPTWIEGDAREVEALAGSRGPYDAILTCPPYADLEVYSDDPRDLSNMPYKDFRAGISKVMNQTEAMLKDDRFAIWVVGEARGKDGNNYGLVSDIVGLAQAAGLHLYNDAVVLNAIASAALRAAKQFNAGRKLVRAHQFMLVFVKGDGKRATAAAGDAEL